MFCARNSCVDGWQCHYIGLCKLSFFLILLQVNKTYLVFSAVWGFVTLVSLISTFLLWANYLKLFTIVPLAFFSWRYMRSIYEIFRFLFRSSSHYLSRKHEVRGAMRRGWPNFGAKISNMHLILYSILLIYLFIYFCKLALISSRSLGDDVTNCKSIGNWIVFVNMQKHFYSF